MAVSLAAQIIKALESRKGLVDWQDVLQSLPPESNAFDAWLELLKLEEEGRLWVASRTTKIPGKAEAVRVPVVRLRPTST